MLHHSFLTCERIDALSFPNALIPLINMKKDLRDAVKRHRESMPEEHLDSRFQLRACWDRLGGNDRVVMISLLFAKVLVVNDLKE